MKRLYILGNGFDVAHKLPTAYLDYRKFLKGSIENKDFCIRMEDTYGLGRIQIIGGKNLKQWLNL